MKRHMIELTLPAMTCSHCLRTVTKAVQAIDAAATLTFDLPSHRVRIESRRPAEELRAAVAKAGYEAA
jgi:copper chaperone CopZ